MLIRTQARNESWAGIVILSPVTRVSRSTPVDVSFWAELFFALSFFPSFFSFFHSICPSPSTILCLSVSLSVCTPVSIFLSVYLYACQSFYLCFFYSFTLMFCLLFFLPSFYFFSFPLCLVFLSNFPFSYFFHFFFTRRSKKRGAPLGAGPRAIAR